MTDKFAFIDAEKAVFGWRCLPRAITSGATDPPRPPPSVASA